MKSQPFWLSYICYTSYRASDVIESTDYKKTLQSRQRFFNHHFLKFWGSVLINSCVIIINRCIIHIRFELYSPPKGRGDILASVRIPLVSAMAFASALTDLYPRYLLKKLMEFHQICPDIFWNKPKSWLGFGDLDLIFKDTVGFRWQILVPTISLEPVDGFPLNLSRYIIWPSLRAD